MRIFVITILLYGISFGAETKKTLDCKEISKACTGCTIENILEDKSCNQCLDLVLDGSVDECKEMYKKQNETVNI